MERPLIAINADVKERDWVTVVMVKYFFLLTQQEGAACYKHPDIPIILKAGRTPSWNWISQGGRTTTRCVYFAALSTGSGSNSDWVFWSPCSSWRQTKHSGHANRRIDITNSLFASRHLLNLNPPSDTRNLFISPIMLVESEYENETYSIEMSSNRN